MESPISPCQNNKQRLLITQHLLIIDIKQSLTIISEIVFRMESRKMGTTIDLLNAVKAKSGVVSDYALAKKLETSQQVIFNHMTKNRVLGDDIALKAASILEIDPAIVLAMVHSERATSESEKSAWFSIFERLGGRDVKLPTLATARARVVKAAEECILCKIDLNKYNPFSLIISQLV